ncbi:hypothetical protein GCM10025870_24240 [Agromyces marinus]|uniref:DUF2207 domain-containing protein n=1 Tax=Agromyces marinus TaxID=1389020 RepID=A0ABM8H3N2_9MICO|nr:DUF2207 domain-containing protein [Agromyces marinus]BDZ55351.1 hypothetical protein GCM10025870_24240 [Agromyces marinus]
MELAAASSGGSGLAVAFLPLVALAASLVAASSVGSLIVAWLQRPAGDPVPSLTDPRTAGLLAVGFVSGRASNRWLAATIMELALAGAITIEDRRNGSGDGSPRDIRLVYAADVPAAHARDETDETADLLISVFSPGLTGGTEVVAHGASIAADRVVARNGSLLAATHRRFLEAAAAYREPRPSRRFRAATVGGTVAVVGGLVGAIFGDTGADSIAWIAIVIGLLALAVRAFLPRWIPLNAAGLELRRRAALWRDELAGADVRDPRVAAEALPWAVLFDQPDLIRRSLVALGSRADPQRWYATADGWAADRVATCLAVAAVALAQPITIGAGDAAGRFGVPLLDEYKVMGEQGYFDHRGVTGGWYAGDGGLDGGFGGGSTAGAGAWTAGSEAASTAAAVVTGAAAADPERMPLRSRPGQAAPAGRAVAAAVASVVTSATMAARRASCDSAGLERTVAATCERVHAAVASEIVAITRSSAAARSMPSVARICSVMPAHRSQRRSRPTGAGSSRLSHASRRGSSGRARYRS